MSDNMTTNIHIRSPTSFHYLLIWKIRRVIITEKVKLLLTLYRPLPPPLLKPKLLALPFKNLSNMHKGLILYDLDKYKEEYINE